MVFSQGMISLGVSFIFQLFLWLRHWGILKISDEVPVSLSAFIVHKPETILERLSKSYGFSLRTIKALKIAGTSSDTFRMPESKEWLQGKVNSKRYHSPREQHWYEEIYTWLFVLFDFCNFSIPLTLVLEENKTRLFIQKRAILS